jgi:hypothetical protein
MQYKEKKKTGTRGSKKNDVQMKVSAHKKNIDKIASISHKNEIAVGNVAWIEPFLKGM